MAAENEYTWWRMLSRLGKATGVPMVTGSTSGTNSLFCWSMTALAVRGGGAAAPGAESETTASATGLPRSSLTVASTPAVWVEAGAPA